jgi:hypothetical protein
MQLTDKHHFWAIYLAHCWNAQIHDVIKKIFQLKKFVFL